MTTSSRDGTIRGPWGLSNASKRLGAAVQLDQTLQSLQVLLSTCKREREKESGRMFAVTLAKLIYCRNTKEEKSLLE